MVKARVLGVVSIFRTGLALAFSNTVLGMPVHLRFKSHCQCQFIYFNFIPSNAWLE